MLFVLIQKLKLTLKIIGENTRELFSGSLQEAVTCIYMNKGAIRKSFEKTNNKVKMTENLKKGYLSFINEGKKIDLNKKEYKPNFYNSRNRNSVNSRTNEIQNFQSSMEFEENEWEVPKKTLKRSLSNPDMNPVKTKNKFAELDEMNNTSNDKSDFTEHAKQQKNSKVKPPPVFTSDIDTRELIKALNEIDKKSFTIRHTGDNNHTIRTTDIKIFEVLKKTLNNKKIKFFTYTPQHLKTKSVVLKHVSGNLSPEELKAEIDSKNQENVDIKKIVKFSPKFKPNEYYYIIILTNDSKISSLTKINNIAQQVPKWEPYKKKVIFQCHKCQEIGHSSKNCFKDYRCVKCLENHRYGECKLPKGQKTENVACINCGEKGHPASYLGCPFLKYAAKTIKTTKINSKSEKIQRENKIINLVTQHKSYANAVNQPVRDFVSQDNIPTATRNVSYQQEIDFKLENLKKEIISVLTTHLDNIILKIKENRSLINNLFSSQTE